MLKTILLKAGDTNQFIRADVEAAMNSLVDNVQPTKAITYVVNEAKYVLNFTCFRIIAYRH